MMVRMPSKKVEISKYTGADYEYDYRQLHKMDEVAIAEYAASLQRRLNGIELTPANAEQWIVRTYASVKYLLAASLMLDSAGFAAARNLKIVVPYLLYYGIFNVSRSVFMMLPEQTWNGGRILDEVTHKKVQNVVADTLRYFSASLAHRYRDTYARAIATREMFSYKFPALGLTGHLKEVVPDLNEVIDICEFLADAAQFHSECIQRRFASLPDEKLPIQSETLKRFFKYEHKSLEVPFADKEDWYRLWQFGKHSNRPWSLHLTARPGLVEDFFGAWSPSDEEGPRDDQYDPDESDPRLIFDFA